MTRLRVFLARLAATMTGASRAERELTEEIQAHLSLLAEEHERRGLSPEEARAAALRDFGGMVQAREVCRDVRRFAVLDAFTRDLRHGFRLVLREPSFSVVAVLTLALGIGATAVVFTFVSTVLSAASPVAGMERLVGVWSYNRAQGEPKAVVSPEDFSEWGRRQRSFDRFAASRNCAVNLSGGNEPMRVDATLVSEDYLAVLERRPALGRTFRADDYAAGAAPVVLVSDRFWRQRFAAEPDVVGREVRLDGRRTVIAGVLVPDDLPGDVLLPLAIDPRSPSYGEHSLFVIGRLRGGVTLEQARAEMNAIGAELERERPDTHRGWGVNTRPLQEEFVGPRARLVFALLVAASLAVLLIGCANIASLMLARGVTRARELAVRAALGASRGRLVAQLLVESLVLASAGAVAGLVVAGWGLGLLRSAFGAGQPVIERAVIDARVLAFVAVTAVASTLFFGLLPALHSAAACVSDTLREGGRAAGGARTRRVTSMLVTGEVTTAVLCLVLAILFMRTLAAFERVEPGFDTDNLLTMRVALPADRYADAASVSRFYDGVLGRLRHATGVIAAGATARVPAAGSRYNPNRSLVIEGRSLASGETQFAADLTVTPGYLETLRIPLRAGRALSSSDAAKASLVVVVSETLVRRYWGAEAAKALGARIRLGDEAPAGAWRTIVGIVGDVRNDDIDAPPLPHVYVPLAQRPSREMTIVVRTSGDPLLHVGAARASVAALDADQPLFEVRSMAQIFEEDLRQTVVLVAVLSLFGGGALLLAAVGIYGVVARGVAQRSHEIGIRMALGASSREVVGLVVREGAVPVGAGLVLGLSLSAAMSRLVAGLLFGVAAVDPLTYAAVVVALAATGLVACAAPARRAVRVGAGAVLRAG